MSCGVGHRCGLELVLLWLWHRPAATAPIQSLAWEPPYAIGMALKKDRREKKRREKDTQVCNSSVSSWPKDKTRHNLTTPSWHYWSRHLKPGSYISLSKTRVLSPSLYLTSHPSATPSLHPRKFLFSPRLPTRIHTYLSLKQPWIKLVVSTQPLNILLLTWDILFSRHTSCLFFDCGSSGKYYILQQCLNPSLEGSPLTNSFFGYTSLTYVTF